MAGNLRQDSGKRHTQGFDRAVRELNAFLLVLAIGLAVLDATCFVAFKVRDALPAANLMNSGPNSATPLGRVPSMAFSPNRPGTIPYGW